MQSRLYDKYKPRCLGASTRLMLSPFSTNIWLLSILFLVNNILICISSVLSALIRPSFDFPLSNSLEVSFKYKSCFLVGFDIFTSESFLCILYTYKNERRNMRSNIPLCMKEFPGTPEGKEIYFTVYPDSSPNTDSLSF